MMAPAGPRFVTSTVGKDVHEPGVDQPPVGGDEREIVHEGCRNEEPTDRVLVWEVQAPALDGHFVANRRLVKRDGFQYLPHPGGGIRTQLDTPSFRNGCPAGASTAPVGVQGFPHVLLEGGAQDVARGPAGTLEGAEPRFPPLPGWRREDLRDRYASAGDQNRLAGAPQPFRA